MKLLSLQSESPLIKESSSTLPFKPFTYQWAYDYWLRQSKMFWTPDEVDMQADLLDWRAKLTFDEKALLEGVFRFFVQGEVEVQNCYMTKYLTVFQPVEVKMMLLAFANMESTHAVGYALVLDTIGVSDSFYLDFMKIKETKAKCDYLHTFKVGTIAETLETLAVFGAFMEGVALYASFAILLNFPRHGLMKGMGQILAWSVRDESLHVEGILALFNELLKSHKDLWTPVFHERLYNICREMVYHEDMFVDMVFAQSKQKALTAEEIKQYVRWIADHRLKALGLAPLYNIKGNPLPWIDMLLYGQEHANFFEMRPTEYHKGATSGSWSDVFDEEKEL
jgi:ribonucleoside-diphosphate reductase beta chain